MTPGLLLAAATTVGRVTAGRSTTATGDLLAILSAGLGVAAFVAGLWRVLQKAGRPGWHAAIPFYNLVEIQRIIDQPWWWAVGLVLPAAVGPHVPVARLTLSLISLFFWLIIFVGLARAFARSWQFGVLMVPLCIVLMPVLGFGRSTYHGPRGPRRQAKPGEKPRQIGRLEAWARAREGAPQTARGSTSPTAAPEPRRPAGPDPNRSKKRRRGRARH